MIATDDTSFADFARAQRGHWNPPRRGPARAMAALVTLTLLALFLAVGRNGFGLLPHPIIDTISVAVPPPASKALPPPPLPFLSHMIRPKVEDAAPPQFSVQPEPTATRAPLSPTVSPAPSPLAGGVTAQIAPGPASSATGSNGNANATTGCLDADWVRAVNARLLGAFHYPHKARLLGITGEVHLRFTVEGNGDLSMLEMDKPSGSHTLNTNAMDMMRAAQPLPAIPARMHVRSVNGLLVLLFGQQFTGGSAPLLTCN
jgi:TonB family protein